MLQSFGIGCVFECKTFSFYQACLLRFLSLFYFIYFYPFLLSVLYAALWQNKHV